MFWRRADHEPYGYGHNTMLLKIVQPRTPRRRETRESPIRGIGNHGGYDTFGNAAKELALKALLKNASASGRA
jgi:hypothetical protein